MAIIESVDNGSKTIGQAHRELVGSEKKTAVFEFDKHFTPESIISI